MRHEDRIGLVLTRCDACGRRQFCAVNGAALCESCCPGAVEQARQDARQKVVTARLKADLGEDDEPLPPAVGDDMGEPVPFMEVAYLFLPRGHYALG